MLHRLFDELIDGFGTEQSPPIAFDLSAEGDVLYGPLAVASSPRKVSPVYRAAGGGVGRVKFGPTAHPPKPKAYASTIACDIGAQALRKHPKSTAIPCLIIIRYGPAQRCPWPCAAGRPVGPPPGLATSST
jgi:hypothetical protein